MQLRTLGLCALLVTAASQSLAAGQKYAVSGKDVPAVLTAEWDAGGTPMRASGTDQVAKAPKGAAVYTVQSVAWPTGTVRVYAFTKAGGIHHRVTDETAFYVIKGSIAVTLDDKRVVLHAGDVASRASGVIRAGDVSEDTSIVAWTVGPVSTDPPAPTVVRADAVKVLTTPAVTINRYDFPGNSVRLAVMAKGVKQEPNTGVTDNMHYFIEGHV